MQQAALLEKEETLPLLNGCLAGPPAPFPAVGSPGSSLLPSFPFIFALMRDLPRPLPASLPRHFATSPPGGFGVRPRRSSVATPKPATRHSSFAQAEPDAMAALEVSPECEAKVNSFKKELCAQAEELVARRFPEKIVELSNFLKSPELNVSDLLSLRVELDIPIPDPKKDEERRKQREKEEKDSKKEEKDSKKSEDEDKAPPCGPVCHNEKITALLNRVKPEIQGTKEKLNVISLWLQLLVPRIEDGNNFGVAVQEKVYELLTSARTKLETFQTQVGKYYSERGDAVSKAAKSPHVGDYRQLVHEIDEAEYAEIRYMINELRNIYAVVYDSTLKNFEKIKKPRDDNKGMIY